MSYELNAKLRQAGEGCHNVGNRQLIPAVVYGPELKENLLICVDLNAVEKLYYEAGESSLINLQIEGESTPREVLFKDIQKNVLTMNLRHVDFYQFKAGQKVDVEVELEFVGESVAVKGLGGVFVSNLTTLPVRCLPKDMVSKITVDISVLESFEDRIHVKDLNIPANWELLVDADDTVASVVPPEEEKESSKETTAEMPEVESKAKTEESAKSDKK